MTPDDIDFVRTARACNVPWTVISRQLGRTVAECRAAIGLPQYDRPAARPAMPWDRPRQQTLSDQ